MSRRIHQRAAECVAAFGVLTLSAAACADTVIDIPKAASSIELPLETVALIESDAPGYALAQQRCQICHSVDYIAYQPPSLGLDAWTDEVRKMRDKYGAPVNETDAVVIGAYLATAYGNASPEEAAAALAEIGLTDTFTDAKENSPLPAKSP